MTNESVKKAAVKSKKGAVEERHPLHKRRSLSGVVVSNKMQKTIVVRVDRSVKHGEYKKYVKDSRKFKCHDEKNDAKVGDLVEVVESRPLSREKRWVLRKIIRRGSGQAEVINTV